MSIQNKLQETGFQKPGMLSKHIWTLMPGNHTVRMCLGKDAKEVVNWIVMLYLTQKSSHDSVIGSAPHSPQHEHWWSCQSSLHYGDKYSYYNCIKLFVRVVLMYQLCSERTISTSLRGKVWNGLACTYQQHLLLNKRFVLHAWICTCDYPTSFIILMASTRCWGGG